MNRLILALALTPALFVTGVQAQTVSDDVTKALWCGEALVIAFSSPPPDITADQKAQAQAYIDGGNALIDKATQGYLNAGNTEEQVTKAKSDMVAEITPIVTQGTDASKARYSFGDCVALLPGQAPAPAAPAAPAADASSSSAAQ
jgi:hypothetical protein